MASAPASSSTSAGGVANDITLANQDQNDHQQASSSTSAGGAANDITLANQDHNDHQQEQSIRCTLFELYEEAMRSRDWEKASTQIEQLIGNEAVLNEITNRKGETALHIAVTHGHKDIVKTLSGKMSEVGLKLEDGDGDSALMVAAMLGDCEVAKAMLEEDATSAHPDLKYLACTARSKDNILPVVMAIDFGQIEMARYLFPLTSPATELLKPKDGDCNGAKLLTRAIYCGALDIALELIRKFANENLEEVSKLVLALDDKQGESAILALASTHYRSPHRSPVIWSKIEDLRLRTFKVLPYLLVRFVSFFLLEKGLPFRQLACQARESRLPVSNRDQQRQCCFNIRISQSQETKDKDQIHSKYTELLSKMCKVVSKSNHQQRKDGLVYVAIGIAARNGNFEFVYEMIKVDISFLWTLHCDEEYGRNIFMIAVLHRQEKIFTILYERKQGERKYITGLTDKEGNNMLHLAGMVENSTSISRLQGAALQMQRELQWFKEVKKMVHPKAKVSTNNDGLTPQQLFMKNHENLMEKGEKWMKNTAASCTVVAAFIVTIIFPTVFTMPGSENKNTRSFKLFIICDALSLLFSTVLVVTFLEILTSRYSEEDFLQKLPRQMILGLFSLFFFLIVVLFALHEKAWIPGVFGFLAFLIVSVFILLTFRLLVSMIRSTYFLSIFDRKSKLAS